MTTTTHTPAGLREPYWCEHGTEPPGWHHGVIQVGTADAGVDVHLTRQPGERTTVVLTGVGAADAADYGHALTLGPALARELCATLARALTA